VAQPMLPLLPCLWPLPWLPLLPLPLLLLLRPRLQLGLPCLLCSRPRQKETNTKVKTESARTTQLTTEPDHLRSPW